MALTCGGGLAGFVALPAYEAQIKAVAQLQGQVGGLAVQLHNAVVDADGARELLREEQCEAGKREGALRARLEGTQVALRELASDHDSLREAHARLVGRELHTSGLLNDR